MLRYACITTYIVVVFIGPWSMAISFIVRELIHAHQSGVRLFSLTGSRQLVEFRLKDRHAASLYRSEKRWVVIALVSWTVGFFILVVMARMLRVLGVSPTS